MYDHLKTLRLSIIRKKTYTSINYLESKRFNYILYIYSYKLKPNIVLYQTTIGLKLLYLARIVLNFHLVNLDSIIKS